MAKRYYFTNESGEWIGEEYIGNIRGARTAAKRLANELSEEIAINTCKEIEYVGEKTAGEEFACVCDADGNVMAVCSTHGAANAWCAKNGITGEIDEFEPYIKLGTFNADGTFEVEDYSSIDEYSGKITLVNDYFQTSEIVCPYEKNETLESVEVAEETTAPEAEQAAETAEQEAELNTEVETEQTENNVESVSETYGADVKADTSKSDELSGATKMIMVFSPVSEYLRQIEYIDTS